MSATIQSLPEKRLDPPRLKHERLRDHLVGDLMAGKLRPGDLLPSEPVLSAQLHLARGTVRKALSAMERSGFIRRVPGKGTFIREDARSRLRTGLDAFALIVPETQSGYYPSLLASFEESARRVGNQVLVVNSHNDVNHQADAIIQLVDKKIAGVALVPTISNTPTPAHQVRLLQNHQIPVVFCHRPVQDVRAPLLALNGWKIGRRAGEAIVEQGHRRVVYLASVRTPFGDTYVDGLRSVLEEAGVPFPDDRVVYIGDSFGPAYEQRMDEALVRIMEQSNRPTAIFTAFDSFAETIYMVLTRRGFSIPKDVSLVGFGGAARLGTMQQHLTSVTVDEAEIGRLAVTLLEEMRRGQRPIESEERFEIPVGLSVGQTLGKAPAA